MHKPEWLPQSSTCKHFFYHEQLPRWCWCCWCRGPTLRTMGFNARGATFQDGTGPRALTSPKRTDPKSRPSRAGHWPEVGMKWKPQGGWEMRPWVLCGQNCSGQCASPILGLPLAQTYLPEAQAPSHLVIMVLPRVVWRTSFHLLPTPAITIPQRWPPLHMVRECKTNFKR